MVSFAVQKILSVIRSHWVFFFFWLCSAACGISVPQPGIEPVPPTVEAWRPNHWTAREVPPAPLVYFHFCFYYSRRLIQKDIAVIYVTECTAYVSL